MNKKFLSILFLSITMPFGVVVADVQGDLDSGLSLQQAYANAMSQGLTVEQFVEQAVSAKPELTGSIVEVAVQNNPDQAEAIVAVAIRIAPDRAFDAVAAATANTPASQHAAIEQSAIQAGADPTIVATATAAGPAAGPAGVTVGAPLPVAPPGGGGSGGGGVASPS